MTVARIAWYLADLPSVSGPHDTLCTRVRLVLEQFARAGLVREDRGRWRWLGG